MTFNLSEEQAMIFDMACGFGADAIAPHALAWEKDGTIPREVLRAAGELGFGAIYVPEDAGGTGLGRVEAVLVFEALSMACPSVAAFISIHNMCTNMVAKYGTEALKDQWLAKLIGLEAVASYCLTEPGSGSDASALRTRAEAVEDGYSLTGNKAFISGGSYSDLYVVMCRTGGPGPKGISTVAVPDGTPGLSFGGLEEKMGWKAQPTSQVQLDGAQIPADHLMGEEGRGFSYAMEGLDGGRLNIAACSLGAAQAAFDRALAYAGERQAFGQPIDQFQSIQFKLAEMETKLQGARLFLRDAAARLEAGRPEATKHCAMAKLLVTDSCFAVANDALQILGGYGYLTEFGIEKLVRDIRVHQILEGTNEIMRLIIGRALLEERQ